MDEAAFDRELAARAEKSAFHDGGEAHPDEGEFLDLVKLPFSELLAMVKRGEISDGKTAIAALQAEHILAGE